MIRRLSVILPALALVVFVISCGGDDGPTQSNGNGGAIEDPSFAANIQSIFNASCALGGRCHATATAEHQLNLSSGQAHGNLVDVNSIQVASLKRVLANDADNSYLVHKISGTPAVGARMPLTGSQLSPNQIQTIKNWINKGAKNN